jgi:glucose/arabinose dehydrogenase
MASSHRLTPAAGWQMIDLMRGLQLAYLMELILLAALAAPADGAGVLTRVANTSLAAMPAAPPVFGYTYTNALPGLTFANPVCLATPPGETNRLFVLEKSGRIIVITNLAAPTRSVFLDLTARVTTSTSISDERGLFSLAFHPGYASNGYFFVYYTGNANTTAGGGGNGLHDILARYRVSGSNSNQANTSSHTPLLLQYDEASNHNGGDIHFGPDGYLYLGIGDEGGANDQYNNSQTITKDFFSAILRLDVDKRPENLAPNAHPAVTTNYGVPADNPFVGASSFNGAPVNPASVRTEFWAVGLRNPWRCNFDEATGLLYCGDVGQDAWEEIDLIQKGGNYGWAYREAFANGPKSSSAPAGFVSIAPLTAYSHTYGIAVTGGRVYRGQRISQLYGAYVYADYGYGTIWALRHTGTNVTQNDVLFSNPGGGVSSFGVDPSNGDLLYCDLQNGTNGVVKRIIYDSTFTGTPIPTNLSAAGVFTNLATRGVAPGIVGYDLNVPFWSDNALKTRWFSLPDTNLTFTFSPDGNWSFPTGTVWIKHFEFEVTNGVPASRRPLETRLLIYDPAGGYGVTYRWTTPPTNALLVAEGGVDEVITSYTAEGANAGAQVWHYPSRVECLFCHTAAAGFALGFNTPQLNRDFSYAGGATNQIEALASAGYFGNAVSNRYLLRALAPATNGLVSLEYRARSYLAANCVQCHQPSGTAQALWDARITTPGPQNGILNGALINNLGDANNRVVVPGSLANSALLQRVTHLGPGHMPPLSTSVVNTQAVVLLAAWITNDLPNYVSLAAWQSNYFGSTNAANAAPLADPDSDGAQNYLEYLTGTNPTNGLSGWSIVPALSNGQMSVVIPQPANRAVEVQATTNLFNSDSWSVINLPANAPFFPASERTSVVSEPAGSVTPRYYRVRVYEP